MLGSTIEVLGNNLMTVPMDGAAAGHGGDRPTLDMSTGFGDVEPLNRQGMRTDSMISGNNFNHLPKQDESGIYNNRDDTPTSTL